MVTKYCSLDFRGTFPNLFVRNLVRDLPYSHVLEDPVSSTTTSPPLPHPLVFVYLEVTACVQCYVSDSCHLVAINGCSIFSGTSVGMFLP